MTSSPGLAQPHLLGIDGMSLADATLILETARSFTEVNTRALKKVPALRGRTVALLFFENSTRTRLSFELAAKRLSADTLSFSASSSSTAKGETLIDTARNIEAMKPDLVVVRHEASGAPWMLSRVMSGAIANAGDGQHEHPTQALLDAYTLLECWKRTPAEGLAGKTIAIVGDLSRSRVARSNMLLLPLLGAKVRVAGPPTMIPAGLADVYDVDVYDDVDEALFGGQEALDAVMMLRIQKERAGTAVMGSDRDYAIGHGLTAARFAQLKERRSDVLVMHPGPMNRGVEIDAGVADDDASVILQQTENGVAVRMAVLYLLAVGMARHTAVGAAE
ncbi:MAG: aspartate carbamoyltransferase catalytic subunit [Deltaproteobacteria bacterium]|nr:aspartate carbamoyltransferase catalytic subunit [Deltaproteobacteria bacterium]